MYWKTCFKGCHPILKKNAQWRDGANLWELKYFPTLEYDFVNEFYNYNLETSQGLLPFCVKVT